MSHAETHTTILHHYTYRPVLVSTHNKKPGGFYGSKALLPRPLLTAIETLGIVISTPSVTCGKVTTKPFNRRQLLHTDLAL